MKTEQRARNLIAYFALTFAISWLLWLPQVLNSNGLAQLPEAVGILGMLAPFGPGIAAFWLTSRQSGRTGVKKLWKRGWSLRFDKIWLLPTVLLIPASGLITIGVLALMGEPIQWEEYGTPLVALVPTFVVIYLRNSLPEEYGWRGYALGRMLGGRNALAVSLILGAIWGLWHLPLHFIEGTAQEAIPVYEFVLQQMVLAVFFTWLYNNTRGSVFVAILFHTVANTVGAAIPYWVTSRGRAIGLLVMVVFAAAIVLIWGPQRLSRSLPEETELRPASLGTDG